jgi:hypothetical protein
VLVAGESELAPIREWSGVAGAFHLDDTEMAQRFFENARLF